MGTRALRRAGGFLQELALPDDCAGCGRAGPGLCAGCGATLVPRPVLRDLGGVPVTSALVYDGVVRRVVVAFKNEGRTALALPLASALREAVGSVVDDVRDEGIVLVPMAPSRRSAVQRGYDPVRVLLRRAGLPRFDVLRLVARPADQVGLGREARFANLAGTAVAARRVRGRPVVLIDDVVTTGATLTEAARAVEAAGGLLVGAATVASTPRRDLTGSMGVG